MFVTFAMSVLDLANRLAGPQDGQPVLDVRIDSVCWNPSENSCGRSLISSSNPCIQGVWSALGHRNDLWDGCRRHDALPRVADDPAGRRSRRESRRRSR